MRVVFLTLLAGLVIFSCRKYSSLPRVEQPISRQASDSMAVAGKLTGEWRWVSNYCFWAGNTVLADKSVTVSFTASGSFTIVENAVVVTQGSWRLESNGSLWDLVLSNRSDYLYGWILFSGNQVMFSATYMDRCNNLFERTL